MTVMRVVSHGGAAAAGTFSPDQQVLDEEGAFRTDDEAVIAYCRHRPDLWIVHPAEGIKLTPTAQQHVVRMGGRLRDASVEGH